MEDLKKGIDSNTFILGDFNTPQSTMEKSYKQNINKDILDLNDTVYQMNLIDIYRIFHSKETKCAFPWNARGSFLKIDHMVCHKPALKIQENWNHMKLFVKQQGLETRNHSQGKKSKTFKLMETEEYAMKQWTG